MNDQVIAATVASYDRIAADYVRHIYHELDGKPLDRSILDLFSAQLIDRGPVCDMGCGPGHIARYLADRGLEMIGVDLSPGMLAQATALNPGIPFHVGNMLSLDVAEGAWAGVVAFYSIIHVPREQVVMALREMRRVMMPGGLLILAFHIGKEIIHVEEMWDQVVALGFTFFEPAEMVGYLEQAGFQVEEVIERDPYTPDVQHQSRRAYILASKMKEAKDDHGKDL